MPAVALPVEGALLFGAEAEDRRFLHPRQVCDLFWEEFSLAGSGVRQGGRELSHSELGFHLVRHIVDALPGAAASTDGVALALPSVMLDGTERSEERVGILLGICGDLELGISTIVDAAVASLRDPEAAPPARGSVLIVDLGLHAATLSVVDFGVTVSRQDCSRLPGAGWLALADLARRTLADRFLRQTSFDVSADRRIEQEFYRQSIDALTTFASRPEAWLRVASGSRERSISVPRDGFAGDLRPLSETIAQGAREMLARMGLGLSGVQVHLTSRARQVCGLATALRSRGAIAVSVLSAGAAARGAAVIACERKRPASLEDVPVETAITVATGEDPIAALRAAFVVKRHGGPRDGAPSHVVIDGAAHPVRANGLRIGVGTSDAGDLGVPVNPVGVGPCQLLIHPGDGGVRASAIVGGEQLSLPGGDAALAPGDSVEIHGTNGVARLLFVRAVR